MHAIKDVEGKMKDHISTSSHRIFLREDFVEFGGSARVSHALSNLQKQSVLEKIGYGVYMLPNNDPHQYILRDAKARIQGKGKRHLVISGMVFSVGGKSALPC